jgi:hypothetical protein
VASWFAFRVLAWAAISSIVPPNTSIFEKTGERERRDIKRTAELVRSEKTKRAGVETQCQ